MVELFWNTDIHAGAAPTTIEELDALAAQYTQFDGDGNLTQAGVIPWEQGGFSAGGYGSWGTIWGARFYDHANRKWTINRPENYAFLDWYLTYVDLFGGREKADALISSIPQNLGYGDIFPVTPVGRLFGGGRALLVSRARQRMTQSCSPEDDNADRLECAATLQYREWRVLAYARTSGHSPGLGSTSSSICRATSRCSRQRPLSRMPRASR